MFELIPALAIFITLFLILHARNSSNKKRVGVVVLGDVGRSPRMRQHCLSLAQEGFQVQYLAERGSAPHPDLLASGSVRLLLLPPYSFLPFSTTPPTTPLLFSSSLLPPLPLSLRPSSSSPSLPLFLPLPFSSSPYLFLPLRGGWGRR